MGQLHMIYLLYYLPDLIPLYILICMDTYEDTEMQVWSRIVLGFRSESLVL